jgi:hypothetical protein
MSLLGRMSRVPAVQTAGRNCTRDGGGPLGFGNQVLISSHRKLLSLKAMVVSVAEKPDVIRQGRLREASASKPLMKCRKRIRRCQNQGVTLPLGLVRGMT